MSGCTYKSLDNGPLETRVKVVIDALGTSRYHMQQATDGRWWIMDLRGEIPDIHVPDDIISYCVMQQLFEPRQGRLQ